MSNSDISMERSQPLAVKVTDLPTDPPKRKSKPPPPVPAKPVIAVDKSISERTKAIYAPASDPKAGKERPEISGLKSIAERQAELRQAIKPQSSDAQATVQVGSVRNRLEEFKAAACQSGAVGNKHAAEVDMRMSERMAIFQNSVKASSGPKGGQETGEEGKNEPLRTGKVAELAAKIANSESKIASKTGPVEVTSGIAARIQLLQQAFQSGSNRPKDLPQEGLPSLQDGKNQLFTKTQPSKFLEDVPFESVKDRIDIFRGLKKNKKYKDSSDEPDEEVEMQVEQVQTEKKPSTQQSLMAKYASKSTVKAKAAVKQGEAEQKKGSEGTVTVPIEPEEAGEKDGEGEWEEVRPGEEGVAEPTEQEQEINMPEGIATDLNPENAADSHLKATEIADKEAQEAESPKGELAEVDLDPEDDLKPVEIADKEVKGAETPIEELAPALPERDLDLKAAENPENEVKGAETPIEELAPAFPEDAVGPANDLKAAEIADKEVQEAGNPKQDLAPALPEIAVDPGSEKVKDQGEGVGIEAKQMAEDAAELPALVEEPLVQEEQKQDHIPPLENIDFTAHSDLKEEPQLPHPEPDLAVPLEPFPDLEGTPAAAPPLAALNAEDQADPAPAEAEAAPPK